MPDDTGPDHKPRVDFYHLQKTTLADALPQLLDKALAAGMRVVVVAGSEDRVEDLNVALWTGERDSWRPHGSRLDGHPADQPIWLTHDPTENPNGASLLVLTDGMDSPLAEILERTLDLFDGHDAAAVEAARGRFRRHLEAGHALTYWQQSDQGRWEVKARRNVDPPADTPATP